MRVAAAFGNAHPLFPLFQSGLLKNKHRCSCTIIRISFSCLAVTLSCVYLLTLLTFGRDKATISMIGESLLLGVWIYPKRQALIARPGRGLGGLPSSCNCEETVREGLISGLASPAQSLYYPLSYPATPPPCTTETGNETTYIEFTKSRSRRM